MSSINKVILVGNLGADPDVRFMPNGTAVATLSVATTESWKDKQTGELMSITEWHRVVLFGRKAEVARDFLKSGSQVYVEGKNQTRSWVDEAKVTRYTTEVIVRDLKMLGRKDSAEKQKAPPKQKPPKAAATPPVNDKEPVTDFDDDIGF